MVDMRAHLEAIQTMLAGLDVDGYPVVVHVVDVPEKPTLPYVILAMGTGRTVSDGALASRYDDLDDILTTKAVAADTGTVMDTDKAVRARLNGRKPVVAGRRCERLRVIPQSLPIYADDQVVLPGTANRHPLIGVTQYDIRSRPTG